MRLPLATVAVLAFAVSPALAQSAPDLVGTWTPKADFSARVGVNPGVTEPVAEPALNQPSWGWTMRIDKQDGRAFHGMSIAPGGKEQRIVGVFRADGQRFTLSTETGSGDGEMVAGGFEVCWSDAVAGYVAVACTTYAK